MLGTASNIRLVLLISLAGAVSLAGPKIDHDATTDFSQYATFGLRIGTPLDSPLAQRTVDEAITRELEAKGYALGTPPDLWVVTHGSVREETEVTPDNFGYGAWYGWRGWGGGYGSSNVNLNTIPIGSLMIDLVDAETDRLVWRGIAQGTIKKNAVKSQRQLHKKVARLFDKYPPESSAN